jgi:hypothetical protein
MMCGAVTLHEIDGSFYEVTVNVAPHVQVVNRHFAWPLFLRDSIT